MSGDGQAPFASAEGDAYRRYVGRYGPTLSAAHLDAAGVRPGDRALDVGCGPGVLTSALVELLGPGHVAAVDPSPSFVEDCRRRLPGVDVRVATAEALPAYDAPFDAVLSQLVVNFLDDADAGVSAMRDAARPGGVVTGVVWDYAEGMTMLRAFWDAALQIDPDAPDEARTMRHSTPDALADLWRRCGLEQVATQGLTASASYASYDDFWEPFTAGIGPAGAYCAGLPAHRLEQLRLSLRERIGSPPGAFELDARAWLVRGRAPDEPPGARFGR